jgi:uncharacterized protein YbjQ (UPF0145 family)
MTNLVLVSLLLIVAYVSGRIAERRHFDDLRAREQRMLGMVTTTLRKLPAGREVAAAKMVDGSVVVSLDYFKRFLASLRGLVGGRIKAFEPLLDRARREALLRMREEALRGGFDMVINVRLETSRLASAGSNGKGTAGVEILAFGTAVKLGAPQG